MLFQRKIGILPGILHVLAGNVADEARGIAIRIHAETAGHKPEIALIVVDDAQKTPVDILAERFNCLADKVDIHDLFKYWKDFSRIVHGAEHEDVSMRGRRDYVVVAIHERIGDLEGKSSHVIALEHKGTQTFHPVSIHGYDRDAAQKRRDGMALRIVKGG